MGLSAQIIVMVIGSTAYQEVEKTIHIPFPSLTSSYWGGGVERSEKGGDFEKFRIVIGVGYQKKIHN